MESKENKKEKIHKIKKLIKKIKELNPNFKLKMFEFKEILPFISIQYPNDLQIRYHTCIEASKELPFIKIEKKKLFRIEKKKILNPELEAILILLRKLLKKMIKKRKERRIENFENLKFLFNYLNLKFGLNVLNNEEVKEKYNIPIYIDKLKNKIKKYKKKEE